MNAEAIIDLTALKANFSYIKQKVKRAKILAMVKSNAYGHGLLEVAQVLNAADALGVANLDEALVLRRAHIKQRIVVLRGFATVEELTAIAAHNLDAVIHDSSQLAILNQTKVAQSITVWLKIDTGMHRFGFAPHEVEPIYHQLQSNSNVKQPIPLMTHLAEAEKANKASTLKQIDIFKNVTQNLVGPKSIANSAAIFNYPEAVMDWVRPGLILYGISPFADRVGQDLGLNPVMSLYSNLTAVKYIQRGAAVGYGATWQAPEDMLLGIAAIGYGDGYPLNNQKFTSPILVNGVECQIVGRVSMDMLAIDLRNCPEAKCGDQVMLWGDNLPIEKIAQVNATIPYELVCKLTNRVKFFYQRN